MKKLSKIMVIMAMVLGGSATWAHNPCSWEVGYVNRINNDLWILVNTNSSTEEINRKERQLTGALLTLDLCLSAHNLM